MGTASQSVDYLPYFPNLNEAQSVGCVKPRRAAEDWMAIGFDPWSAGKEPLTTQLVLDLSATLGTEVDENLLVRMARHSRRLTFRAWMTSRRRLRRKIRGSRTLPRRSRLDAAH